MSEVKRQRRALVMGGSVGGLNAAMFLREIGYDVDIFERSPKPLFGRGAGIVLNSVAMKAVEGEGSEPRHKMSGLHLKSLLVQKYAFIAKDNSTVFFPTPARFVSYNTLIREYTRIFGDHEYHLGKRITRIEQNEEEETVSVYTDDGDKQTGDILICADGTMSDARERLLNVKSKTQFSGYYAWRGIVRQKDIPEDLRKRFGEAAIYHLGDSYHSLCYPIPIFENEDDQEPELYMNWLWYRNFDGNVDEFNRKMMTDKHGVTRERAVPPGHVKEDLIEILTSEAKVFLPHDFYRLIDATPFPFIQAVYDVSIEQMRHGRAIFIGDAAFTPRPHIATASAKAMVDARLLADALKKDNFLIGDAVKQWEMNQICLGHDCVERSRVLGMVLQSGRYDPSKPVPIGLYKGGDSFFRPKPVVD